MIPVAWAKLSRNEDEIERADYLALSAHSADVAAVAVALLDRTLLGTRVKALSMTSGRAWEDVVSAIVGAAFLHDIGKCNAGFWRRQFDPSGTPPRRAGPEPRAGHLRQVGPLLTLPGSKATIPVEPRAPFLAPWLDAGGGAGSVFLAALAHHGRPVSLNELSEAARNDAPLWQPAGGYDPLEWVVDLGVVLERWRPGAAAAAARVGPLPPHALHAIAGLVTLADWIGSNRGFFDFAATTATSRPAHVHGRAAEVIGKMGLEAAPAREALAQHPPAFGSVFRDADGTARTPTDLQAAMADLSLGPIVIAESETGSGKTEAALWRWHALFAAGAVDGLAFLLPTRVAAVAIEQRVRRFVGALFADPVTRPNIVLAVPGYARADGDDATLLPRFEVTWPDSPDDAAAHRRWAAENPKRGLAAAVAVATIDQALLGALMTRHAHLRGVVLLRSLLVVDEVHASDPYMTQLLREVLARQVAAGGHALLLSATLGSDARRTLLAPDHYGPTRAAASGPTDPYPAVWDRAGHRPVAAGGRCKQVEITCAGLLDDADAIAARAAAAAQAGARVLVIRNTVAGVLAVQRALEARGGVVLFRAAGVVAPHHGRFAAADRRVLDAAVEAAFGRGAARQGGLVLCGSQTLEVSLDIDADLLLTDLCPMDVLLQRTGRMHRHAETQRPAGHDAARALVLTPPARDLAPLLVRARHGLGGTVYPNLLAIEATWRLLEANPVVAIPADNRRLVEGATHRTALFAIAAELGGRWEKARQIVAGKDAAAKMIARQFALDWCSEWDQVVWPTELDGKISTRLGLEDRRFALAPAIFSPFGQLLDTTTIPGWMARGLPPEIETATSAPGPEGAHLIRVGTADFVYGRLGLERG